MDWLQKNIVALIAVIISAFSFWFSRKALSIEETREDERKFRMKKANLIANISSDYTNIVESKYVKLLILHNEGESAARNIEVLIDEIPITKHDAVLERSRDDIPIIAAHANVRIGLKDKKLPHSFVIEISWDDDTDKKGNFKTTLKKI